MWKSIGSLFACFKVDVEASNAPQPLKSNKYSVSSTILTGNKQSSPRTRPDANDASNCRNIIDPSNRKISEDEYPGPVYDRGEKKCIGEFEIHSVLGTGSQAEVVLAKHTQTGNFQALKLIDKMKLNSKRIHQINTEIAAMQSINHPNVLKLRDVKDHIVPVEGSRRFKKVIVLVLDFCPEGELLDFMLHIGGFSEILARTYFKQLVSAISTCHEYGIFHRDIKPENILLDKDFQVQVADFGLSALRNTDKDICSTYCGTPSYMAPEILAGQEYSGAKADSWSLGILLFVMLAGNLPLASATYDDWCYRAIKSRRMDHFWKAHKKLSPEFPSAAQSLLNRLLVAEPNDRCFVKEILDDPWLLGPTIQSDKLQVEMSLRRSASVATAKAIELDVYRKHEKSLKMCFNDSESICPDDIDLTGCEHFRMDVPNFDSTRVQDCIFRNPSEGFYCNEIISDISLKNLRKACRDAGAVKVYKISNWRLSARFLPRRTQTFNNLSMTAFANQSYIELELQIFPAHLDNREVIFVKICQQNGDSNVINNIVTTISRTMNMNVKN